MALINTGAMCGAHIPKAPSLTFRIHATALIRVAYLLDLLHELVALLAGAQMGKKNAGLLTSRLVPIR